jgi:hypothetical protein
MIPAMLDNAAVRRRNVIIRPHGPEHGPEQVTLLQLDDLKAQGEKSIWQLKMTKPRRSKKSRCVGKTTGIGSFSLSFIRVLVCAGRADHV